MINIPNKLLKCIKDGEVSLSELENYLLSNHSISEIIRGYAELIMVAECVVNKPQITVTQEEFDAITSLFKIKGIRTVDGVVIEETRGRKKKIESSK